MGFKIHYLISTDASIMVKINFNYLGKKYQMCLDSCNRCMFLKASSLNGGTSIPNNCTLQTTAHIHRTRLLITHLINRSYNSSKMRRTVRCGFHMSQFTCYSYRAGIHLSTSSRDRDVNLQFHDNTEYNFEIYLG